MVIKLWEAPFYLWLRIFRWFSFYGRNKYPSETSGFADVAMIDPVRLCVYSYPKDLPIRANMVRHEDMHIMQAKREGRIMFIIKYLWGLRKGYYNNPFEVEARNAENR